MADGERPIAQLDQAAAGIGVHVDALVATQRGLMADRTDVEASADIAVMFDGWPHLDVCAVAAVAVMRLEALTREADGG